MSCLPRSVAVLAIAGCISGCRSRAGAALADGVRYVDRWHHVTLWETVADLSALFNVVIIACLAGIGLSLTIGLIARVWAPFFARASLCAALGFASVFLLTVTAKVALVPLAWSVLALFVLGLISAAVVLRRVLPLAVQRLKEKLELPLVLAPLPGIDQPPPAH